MTAPQVGTPGRNASGQAIDGRQSADPQAAVLRGAFSDLLFAASVQTTEAGSTPANPVEAGAEPKAEDTASLLSIASASPSDLPNPRTAGDRPSFTAAAGAPVPMAPGQPAPEMPAADAQAAAEPAPDAPRPPEPAASQTAPSTPDTARAVAAADLPAAAAKSDTVSSLTPPDPRGSAPAPEPAVRPDAVRAADAAPRTLAIQIVQPLAGAPDRTVEVALEPEELGRVRLSMTTTEQGVTVQVQTDRHDTLDLMRRHAAVLEREFRDAGFGSVAFSFSSDGGTGKGTPDRDEAPAAPAAGSGDQDAGPTLASLRVPLGPGRLDLRI